MELFDDLLVWCDACDAELLDLLGFFVCCCAGGVRDLCLRVLLLVRCLILSSCKAHGLALRLEGVLDLTSFSCFVLTVLLDLDLDFCLKIPLGRDDPLPNGSEIPAWVKLWIAIADICISQNLHFIIACCFRYVTFVLFTRKFPMSRMVYECCPRSISLHNDVL